MNQLVHKEKEGPPDRTYVKHSVETIEIQVFSLLDSGGEGWPELVSLLHPLILQLCGYRVSKNDSASDDMCRDVATSTLERLCKEEYAALKRYRATANQYSGLTFKSWLRVVVRNVHNDAVRALPESHRRRVGPHRQVVHTHLQSLSEDPVGSDNILQRIEVRRILSWVSDPDFPKSQRQAIYLWLRGHDETEIATVLTLPGRSEATRLLRAARQRLRRKFEDRQ